MDKGLAIQRWKKSHAAGGDLRPLALSATVISVGFMIGLSPVVVDRVSRGLTREAAIRSQIGRLRMNLRPNQVLPQHAQGAYRLIAA
ncbi:MAG TPA: hypothetical protein VD995_25765 [Azospirillum sp.]|nr:hypothetical protein [Azospirillum sp.]